MKFSRFFSSLIVIILCAAVLTACAGVKPEDAVSDYLNALVSKDSNRLSSLSCADWESSALLELDSFQAVTVKLENVACKKVGDEGNTALVQCQGKLIATYNTEDMEIDLSGKTYKVINQGGDYLVCGYK